MPGAPSAPSRWTTAQLVLGVVAVSLLAPAGAQAQSSAGGALAAPAPKVAKVICRRGCAGALPKAGAAVAFEGSGLRDVVSVTFLGSPVAGDEVQGTPYKTSEHRVMVSVPPATARGRAVLTDSEGNVSKPSPVLRIVKPAAPKVTGGPIATVVTTRKAFIDGERQPTLTFSVTSGRAALATVQVVRAADAAVVATFDQGTIAAGEQRAVAWDGTAGGVPQPDGRYAFVVTTRDVDSGTPATTAQATGTAPPDDFRLLGHRFPIRGKHVFGTGAAAFGGGRGHEGQDVFAACGTPLAAARGGVVKMKRYQERAGNYLVIDGEDTDVDMAYMHLRDPALVEKGARVHTGELIGYVGDTGRADGCHLHFEEWSGPGWYTGGRPFDPLPDLQAWDAVD